MLTSSSKKRVALGLIAATLGAGFAMSSGSEHASADPTQLNALVAMGSDTTQDVMNAFAGFNNGINYPAINSGSGSGYKHIISFDATPSQTASDNCVTPVINGPTFTRPNGSGAGRKALWNSQGGGTGWTGVTFTLDSGTVLGTCATTVNLTGAVQIARSSALSGTVGTTDSIFIPFARDAVTFSAYRPGDTAHQTLSLTRKNLIDAFNSTAGTRVTVPDPDGTGSVTLVPCGIQTSSGTMQFFRDTVTQATANENTATTECNNAGNGVRVQESKGDLIKAKGDALFATGTYAGDTQLVVITGYSAAAWIAQANGASQPNGYNFVTLGEITDDSVGGTGGANLGFPVVGASAPYSPNATFYASAGIGRDVYNQFKRSNIVNVGTGALLNNAYTNLFADGNAAANNNGAGAVDNGVAKNSSVVCQTGTRIKLFGFAEIENCGDYQSSTLIRSWTTGAS